MIHGTGVRDFNFVRGYALEVGTASKSLNQAWAEGLFRGDIFDTPPVITKLPTSCVGFETCLGPESRDEIQGTRFFVSQAVQCEPCTFHARFADEVVIIMTVPVAAPALHGGRSKRRATRLLFKLRGPNE